MHTPGRLVIAALFIWALVVAGAAGPSAAPQERPPATTYAHTRFVTSHDCMACHNGLTTRTGEDVSIGTSWRGSVMANSARDPYWQAAVRRETIDHPDIAAAIEDECATCHMPMARAAAAAAGRTGAVFAHLPIDDRDQPGDRLAADGVSCALCHQITNERLGTPASFSGQFVTAGATASGHQPIFGPFAVDIGRQAIMQSSTTMTPTEAAHVRESGLCASCHTLYTHARGRNGEPAGTLPEQVPYLEWAHSAYRAERSCQSCHMPPVAEPTPIASVLGEPREAPGRHTFLGGNFFLLRMLNRYRDVLGVEALPQELEMAARATEAHLAGSTARLAVNTTTDTAGALTVDVDVENLTGHKLPTAYPSRRAWLHVRVRDGRQQTIFESGAIDPSGAIQGNDNDADASRFEPHYREIRRTDQVQIYESIMHDAEGGVTTGLLRAVAYAKDNRLLPRGFDAATAPRDIAVIGDATGDPDFTGGGDGVRYVVDTSGHAGPFDIDVELRYQPIGYRWAHNLEAYRAEEPQRFVRWFREMSPASSTVVARATQRLPR